MTHFTRYRFPPTGGLPAAFLCLLLLLSCLLPIGSRAAEIPGETVRISILSKSLRELREQSLKNISMTFPGQTALFNKATGHVAALQRMNIVWREGRFLVQQDEGYYIPLQRCTVYSSAPGAAFTVRIGRQRRTYPLPLAIHESDGDFLFIIEEEKRRYALDAAAAELGYVPQRQREALYALGLLILSRIDMQSTASSHTGFDFCDLTHCQVYFGRQFDGDPSFAASFRIDHRRLPGPLHFSARCGGRTLGGGVFSLSSDTEPGVQDRLTQRGVYLCSQDGYEWQASISAGDLARIVCADEKGATSREASVSYDRDRLILRVSCGETLLTMAPEDFRLKLNRVRGWNFLPGNHYDISRSNSGGESIFIFKGKGLGHGAGLCQAGAMKLAALGYSRYDILRHYFPGIAFTQRPDADGPESPDISYAVFSLQTGRIEQTSHGAFIEREIPPGSIFKLIVSLYLAVRKPSFLDEYAFRCPDDARGDADMPARCWLPEGQGHGRIGFGKALSHSCNLYFGSLHRHIAQDDFFAFYNQLRTAANLTARLPDIKNRREYSRLLVGLDQRVWFSVRDMITLTQIVGPLQSDATAIEAVRLSINPRPKAAIHKALIQTMIDGTGAHPFDARRTGCRTLWGKTATVSDGTNALSHWGIFIGGCDESGIILVRRNAVGRDAAKSAVAIFTKWSKKEQYPHP